MNKRDHRVSSGLFSAHKHYFKSILIFAGFIIVSTIGFLGVFGYGGSSLIVTLGTSSISGDHYSLVDFNSSIIGWWRGESNTNDETGGNDGTWTGSSSYVAGKFGNAFEFSGSSNYVSVSNTGIPTGTSPISISVWVKWLGGTGKQECAVGMGRGTANSSHLAVCVDSRDSDNHIFIGHWGSGDWDTGVSVSEDVWHHLVYVSNRTDETVYLDGTQVATRAISYSLVTNPTVKIGSWFDEVATYYDFKGKIDEPIIFSRAITSAEVSSLYSAQSTQYSTTIDTEAGSYTLIGYAVETDATKHRTAVQNVTAPGSSDMVIAPLAVTLDSTAVSGEQYSFVNLDSSLRGWWRGEGNADDEIGTNDATPTSMTYASGKYGQNFSFSGSGTYLDMGRQTTLDGSSSGYSISIWAKKDTTTSNRVLFSYDNDDTLNGGGSDSYTYWKDGSYLTWNFGSNGIENNTNITDLSDGNWHHLVFTFDRNVAKAYEDGVLKSEICDTGIVGGSGYKLRFGFNENNSWWKGGMDDILLFSRAITSGEVSSLYNAQSTQYSATIDTTSSSHTLTGYAVKTDGTRYKTSAQTATAPGSKALVLDTTAPTVSTLSPADNATGVAIASNLTMTFNESVATSTGNIVIKKKSDDTVFETISITSSNITGGGTETLTINPTGTLAYSTEYYVQVGSTAIQDLSWNSYAGISDTTSWSFTTTSEPDTTAPTVSTLSPADGATDIAIDSNLQVTFSENVVVDTGNVTIKKSSDDSTIETIDVTSGNVTGTGTNTITINPTADLTNSVSYYVQIDATAFKDEAGNHYAGISDSTTWNFTTVAATPVATTVSSGGNGSPFVFDQFSLHVTPFAPGSWYRVTIDKDHPVTNSRVIEINLDGGRDTAFVRIDEIISTSTISKNIEGDMIDYEWQKKFLLSEGNGKKEIVVRFYNSSKQLLAIVPGSISLQGNTLNIFGQLNIFDSINELLSFSNVRYGEKNLDIFELQEKLKLIGLISSKTEISGYYGDVTKQAVTKFNRLKILNIDDLISITKRRETSVYVLKLQMELQKLGFIRQDQEISGYYGPITQEAVKAYKGL